MLLFEYCIVIFNIYNKFRILFLFLLIIFIHEARNLKISIIFPQIYTLSAKADDFIICNSNKKKIQQQQHTMTIKRNFLFKVQKVPSKIFKVCFHDYILYNGDFKERKKCVCIRK